MKKATRMLLMLGARLVLAFCVIVISYEATVESSLNLQVIESDKVLHFLAFYCLTFLADFAFPGTAFGYRKIVPLLIYGILIEVVQSWLPFRSSSVWDLLADLAGIGAYILSVPMLKRIPLLRERWEV
jgi:VanZ family protein